MRGTILLRRGGGRLFTAAVAAVAVAILAWEALSYPLAQWWREPALPLVLVVCCWLLWVAPTVRISAEGIRVTNTWRIHDVPWEAVSGTSRRFGLRLHTTGGDIAVAACPAPSALGMAVGRRTDDAVPQLGAEPGQTVRASLTAREAAAFLEHCRQQVAPRSRRGGSGAEGTDALASRWNLTSIGLSALALVYAAAALASPA